ncbi:MAG: RagB/SusD family nutrient uptake outer membrane protein [Bacteroidota bacterium]
MLRINKATCLLSLLFFLSCEDLVEEIPEDRIPISEFYQAASDAEAAIIGAYNFSFRSANSTNYLFYANRSSDDITAPIDGQQSDPWMWRPNMDANFGNVSSLWAACYQALANINLLLERVEEMDSGVFLNQQFPNLDRKSQILAEARFLRAWNYYNMVLYWGEVPLVVDPPSGVDPREYQVPRASKGEVMNLVMEDLDYAEQRLPENYDFLFTGATDPDDAGAQPTQKGRATIWAAKMLLARIAMQNQDWNRAIELSREVINSGRYPLSERWVNIFDATITGSQNASESILEIQSLAGAGEFNNTGGYSWFTIDGRPRRGATLEAFNLFEGDDDNVLDVRKVESMNQSSTPTEIYAIKYANANPWWNPDNGDPFNFVIFRSTEAYLNIAEALNEQSYPSIEALNIVNRIRSRAQDLQYNPPTAGIENWDFIMFPNQESFRMAIREERRRELMFEGQRWWDMIRYDEMDGTALAPQAVGLTDIQPGYNIENTKLLAPVPTEAIRRNPNLSQNAAYQ